MKLLFVEYSKEFLEKSWEWLNDPDIKKLTNTSDFTRKDQVKFFDSLSSKKDYFIKGILYNNIPIGACGLKYIADIDAEYWGYIGEKEYWGKGLGKEILKYMIVKGKDLGLHSIYLYVTKDNLRAIRLYQNIGFKTEEETESQYKMRLNLS